MFSRNAHMIKTAAAGLLLAFMAFQNACADIKLSPLRQVITPDAPAAVFEISNPSSRILEARVSWIDLRATQTGYASADAELRRSSSAAPYLVVSPAQFQLEPGARTSVTVRIKDGAQIPKGERRSHLLIETGASRTPIRKAGGGLPVDIGLGVSAPVMIRNGGDAKAQIEDVKLLRDDDGLLLLSLAIAPKGDISTFGRVDVTFASAQAPEAPELLSVRRNVSGYADAEKRIVEAPLGFVNLGPGKLTVRYQGEGEFDGRIFDARTFDVAPPE